MTRRFGIIVALLGVLGVVVIDWTLGVHLIHFGLQIPWHSDRHPVRLVRFAPLRLELNNEARFHQVHLRPDSSGF